MKGMYQLVITCTSVYSVCVQCVCVCVCVCTVCVYSVYSVDPIVQDYIILNDNPSNLDIHRLVLIPS